MIATTLVILQLSVRGAHRPSPITLKMTGRRMGLLLCAMSVQFMINALRQLGMPLNA